MWILKPQNRVWHYLSSDNRFAGACGSKLPETASGQEKKPSGFDGLLCNRCWFEYELDSTSSVAGLSRERLAALNYSGLSDSDRDWLYGALGEDRVDSLAVIQSLSATWEPEKEAEPIVPAALLVKKPVEELVAIPLAIRQPAFAPEAEPEEIEPEATPAEPRLKVNYSRRPPERPQTGGFGRLLRRITERT